MRHEDWPVNGFADHFSGHAGDYRRFRPGYPQELFHFLATAAPGRERAWDCATGNGQAALALAAHFDTVIATDASAEQLERAVPHPRVHYQLSPAESTGLPAASIDLITAAQAAHWFDLGRFYAECRRVARSGGIVAVWAYGLNATSPELDTILAHLYEEILGSYWPRERRYIDDGYQSLSLPFSELPAPEFIMRERWTLPRYVGYLGTWSALRRYRSATGRDPLAELAGELEAAWGNPLERREVSWPIYLRVGVIRDAE